MNIVSQWLEEKGDYIHNLDKNLTCLGITIEELTGRRDVFVSCSTLHVHQFRHMFVFKYQNVLCDYYISIYDLRILIPTHF